LEPKDKKKPTSKRALEAENNINSNSYPSNSKALNFLGKQKSTTFDLISIF
jgi:hypothetical protein